MNNKITTCIWFDNQAEEATRFYIDVFGGKVGKVIHYPNTGQEITGGVPGSVMTVEFEIGDQGFMGLNGGPVFTPNPSVSFMVNYDPSQMENAEEKLNETWDKLSEGAKVLMPLGAYPFSKRYGWIQDKYGVSWQLILTDPNGDPRPFIIPSLLFVGDKVGKAEEAAEYYVSVFKDAKIGEIARYPAGMEPDIEGTVMFEDFMLEGQWFAAMDSAREHGFTFSEAISFVVNCKTQEEVDYYWEKLSAVPEAEQCGWLKDKYGVSWQITPTVFNEFEEGEGYDRMMSVMLQMKKLDIAELRHAYSGE